MMIEQATTNGLGFLTQTALKNRASPPSGQEAATQTVLRQAELPCAGWT